mgnify:CR=1 FL=1
MMTLAAVDEYFEHHLQKSAWEAAGEEKQAAAFAMAELDVSGELNEMELDAENRLHVAAVAEQALYLLSQQDAEPADALSEALVSESIDGIGSRQYAARSGRGNSIGSRARNFIDRIRGSISTVRIVRG